MLVTDALILISANHLGWPISYATMAVLMGVGICASLVAIEPPRTAAAVRPQAASTPALERMRGFTTPWSARSPNSFACTAGSRC